MHDFLTITVPSLTGLDYYQINERVSKWGNKDGRYKFVDYGNKGTRISL